MKPVAILLAMAVLAAAPPAGARTHGPGLHRARAHPAHMPRPHRLRFPRSRYRTVRVRRPDGTVMTGYRDSEGTHLHGPDGRTVHCRRQSLGVADVDIACQ